MSQPDSILIVVLALGVFGRNNLVTVSALLLLAIRHSGLEGLFSFLERRGLEVGFVFLIMTVLVPFARGKIDIPNLVDTVRSLPGLLAIAGGALATYLSGRGLDLLQVQPQIIIGLIVGSIIGISFLRGVPVGPLIAAGFTAVFLQMFGR